MAGPTPLAELDAIGPETYEYGSTDVPIHTWGFGIGEHFCLGANLARLELRVIFSELAKRLDEIERAGPYDRMRPSLLVGVKRMAIRYRLRAS